MATRNLVNRDKPSFKQQNLPAWQPILTAGTVLPTFFLIGVAFVPIGIGLLMSSSTVQEKIIDYTYCKDVEKNVVCADLLQTRPSSKNGSCNCRIPFQLDEDYRKDLYVYYGLTNFYQNHRRYVKSRDDKQLLGYPSSVSNGECYPFDYGPDPKNPGKRLPIAPCGAIANSLFNDSFAIRYTDANNKEVILHKEGIAWSSDKRIRFQNPPYDAKTSSLEEAFKDTAKPPNWEKPVYKLGNHNQENNGFQYEPLMVWMRTAALPTFRKLYGIVALDAFEQGAEHLPKGTYQLDIEYKYPVTAFNGRKRFIISNTSWLGGKNNFIGIAYIIVGTFCFLIAGFLLFIHRKYGRSPSERVTHTTPYLSDGM